MTNVLSFELEKTASWRDRKAERHPEDWRNAVAAKRLRELADSQCDASLSDRYDDLTNEVAPHTQGEILSGRLGDIGFRWDPESVDDVLTAIVTDMDEARSATSGHGDEAA